MFINLIDTQFFNFPESWVSNTYKNGTILEVVEAKLVLNLVLQNLTPLEERDLDKFNCF